MDRGAPVILSPVSRNISPVAWVAPSVHPPRCPRISLRRQTPKRRSPPKQWRMNINPKSEKTERSRDPQSILLLRSVAFFPRAPQHDIRVLPQAPQLCQTLLELHGRILYGAVPWMWRRRCGEPRAGAQWDVILTSEERSCSCRPCD